MTRMNRFLQLGFLPRHIDTALLVVRVWLGLGLFFAHGLGKLQHFSQMSAHFPDPLHIGALPSLLFAVLSDSICSLLVAIGFATRLAALIIVIDTAVAFVFVHHLAMSGPGSGELAWVYMGGMFALVIAGAGRFSIDRR